MSVFEAGRLRLVDFGDGFLSSVSSHLVGVPAFRDGDLWLADRLIGY